MNPTTDPALRSWLSVPPESHFPIQNLPYGVFRRRSVGPASVGGADNALQANWVHLPGGYHGRSSSLVVTGTPVRRPCGQSKPEKADTPIFGPSRSLDFELEMGSFLGPGNDLGQPIPVTTADQ